MRQNTATLYAVALDRTAIVRRRCRNQPRAATAAPRFTIGKLEKDRRDGEESRQPAAQCDQAEPAWIDLLALADELCRRQQEQRRHQEVDGVLVHEHGIVRQERVERCQGGGEQGQAVVARQVPDHQRHDRDGRDAAGEREDLKGPLRIRKHRIQPAPDDEQAWSDVYWGRESRSTGPDP